MTPLQHSPLQFCLGVLGSSAKVLTYAEEIFVLTDAAFASKGLLLRPLVSKEAV